MTNVPNKSVDSSVDLVVLTSITLKRISSKTGRLTRCAPLPYISNVTGVFFSSFAQRIEETLIKINKSAGFDKAIREIFGNRVEFFPGELIRTGDRGQGQRCNKCNYPAIKMCKEGAGAAE
jgi:hypothetical protein